MNILAFTLRTLILPLKHRVCFQSDVVKAVMPGKVPEKLGSLKKKKRKKRKPQVVKDIVKHP